MSVSRHTNAVKSLAKEIGFDACGIAPATFLEKDALHLEAWLSAKYHADMKWMENHFEKRTNPAILVEGAKSVIVVLLNYFPQNYPFKTSKYKISRYALGIDYHKVIKEKLTIFFNRINEEIIPIEGRCFVDSAPVLERALAREAGLGWMGKNSLLLSKNLGSYFFIGELIVNAEFEYDVPTLNQCGTCTKCIDSCPTQAIVSPGVVDSNRCLSYHTIENRNEIPSYIGESMNGRVFGCDICQEVCPWNGKSKANNIPEFAPSTELLNMNDELFEEIDENKFETLFAKTAVKRTKFSGFVRNIRAAKEGENLSAYDLL